MYHNVGLSRSFCSEKHFNKCMNCLQNSSVNQNYWASGLSPSSRRNVLRWVEGDTYSVGSLRNFQWLRLALSEGPNRVNVVHVAFSPENGNTYIHTYTNSVDPKLGSVTVGYGISYTPTKIQIPNNEAFQNYIHKCKISIKCEIKCSPLVLCYVHTPLRGWFCFK
jgi:hypothetical protein